jgi:hypothetical protein
MEQNFFYYLKFIIFANMTEKEKFFWSLIEGFEWRYDNKEYPSYLFLFKESLIIFEFYKQNINQKKIITSYRLGIEQDFSDIPCWVHNKKIWSLLEKKFDTDSYEKVEFFIKDFFARFLKINNLEPLIDNFPESINKSVEEYFKNT